MELVSNSVSKCSLYVFVIRPPFPAHAISPKMMKANIQVSKPLLYQHSPNILARIQTPRPCLHHLMTTRGTELWF